MTSRELDQIGKTTEKMITKKVGCMAVDLNFRILGNSPEEDSQANASSVDGR
jgi:hypothetical protein